MKFRITGEFNELSPVRNWQPHSGIDLATPEGTTLRALSDGIVDRVFDGTGAIGKGLSIKFPDGTRAIYGHMNEVKARIGERVHAGDIIGLSGNTGNSTGAHLHFGLKDASGNVLDPTPLAGKLAAITGANPNFGVLGNLAAEGLRGKAADVTTEILLGIIDAVKDLLLAGTLVGSAVLILLKVAGWRDGGRWAGVLLVANVLIKFLFGVY
jgi:Peptidase family M23